MEGKSWPTNLLRSAEFQTKVRIATEENPHSGKLMKHRRGKVGEEGAEKLDMEERLLEQRWNATSLPR